MAVALFDYLVSETGEPASGSVSLHQPAHSQLNESREPYSRSRGEFGRAFFRHLLNALPIQETDRIVIVVDEPDWAKVCKIQDSVLGEIRHVVNDAVGLVAIIPGYGSDTAVFDSTSHLHFTGYYIILTGSQMLVSRNARPLRAIYKNCPMTCLLGCPKHLQANTRKPLNPRLLIFELLIVQRVASCLVASHLFLPRHWLRGERIDAFTHTSRMEFDLRRVRRPPPPAAETNAECFNPHARIKLPVGARTIRATTYSI
jgi:hypothetical protein